MAATNCNFTTLVRGICLLALFCVVTSPALAEQQGTTSPSNSIAARDDGVRRALVPDQKMSAADGGSLTRGINNVLIDRHSICRWLDNNSTENDYFVPTGRDDDWQAFTLNKPSLVRADACCPDTPVTITASDGQTHQLNPGIGRENSTGPFGQQVLSHNFTVTNAYGATYTETVTEQFICRAGAWIGQGATTTGAPGSWDSGAWGACSASCEGSQTRTVVCKDSGGIIVADTMCGGAKPAVSQSCGEESCSLPTDANGACGTAAGYNYDRGIAPPASSGRSLCSNGTATAPYRRDAITWEWTCKGLDTTAVCTATRTGAAVVAKSDCRPYGYDSPPQNEWHNQGDYYTYVCGVDRRMPQNSALTMAQLQGPYMSSNYGPKYSCNKAGYPRVIGASTGGNDWHKAYYTGVAPNPGTTGADLDNNANYYIAGRGDQCKNCVVLEDVYCTDEADYPAGCASKDVEYTVIPPAGACEPPRDEKGTLPAGTFGQTGTMGNTQFTCGLYGWQSSGTVTYGNGMREDNIQCW